MHAATARGRGRITREQQKRTLRCGKHFTHLSPVHLARIEPAVGVAHEQWRQDMRCRCAPRRFEAARRCRACSAHMLRGHDTTQQKPQLDAATGRARVHASTRSTPCTPESHEPVISKYAPRYKASQIRVGSDEKIAVCQTRMAPKLTRRWTAPLMMAGRAEAANEDIDCSPAHWICTKTTTRTKAGHGSTSGHVRHRSHHVHRHSRRGHRHRSGCCGRRLRRPSCRIAPAQAGRSAWPRATDQSICWHTCSFR